MNAEEYKNLINKKDVLDYTTLNVTLEELISRQEIELAGAIKRILESNQIAKPQLHSKIDDISTSYHRVTLSYNDIEKIVDIFIELEAIHIGEDGETTPTASFYASLADKWNHLA
jgi:hypothetical protein